MRKARVTGIPATVCVLAALALSGCQMSLTGGEAARGDSALALVSTSPRVVERDVEAPQVFDRADTGLWDGRPSLGGVWVAHPQAADPERVIIRNPATGASVVGALFRRERDNPGPRYQVSSEAAAALGLLAGAPAQLHVTALRLERVEVTPELPAVATTVTDSGTAAPVVQTALADAAPAPAPAGAALPVPADAPAPTAVTTATPSAPPASGQASAVAGASETLIPLPDAEAAPAARWSLADLFRRRPAQPEPIVELAAVAVPAALPEGVTMTTPSATTPRAITALDRPFVQIGIFSIETNATGARTRMQQAGLPVDIRRGRAGEREFWRVIVGPAADTATRADMLRQVRALGFADAYAVAR